MSFTIATYNAHWGVGKDGVSDLDRVAGAAQLHGAVPDIVCLQEIHQHTSKFPTQAQAQIIAEKLGLKYVCFAPTMAGHPQKHDSVGGYGNAILSRYPIHTCGVLNYQLGGIFSKQNRQAVAVHVYLPQKVVKVITTHLPSDPLCLEQYNAIVQLRDWLQAGDADIICGDFNFPPVLMKHMLQSPRWQDTWLACGRSHDLTRSNTESARSCGYTDGVTFGKMRIDYIFSSVFSIKPFSVDVPQKGVSAEASDHFPLFLKFDVIKDRPRLGL